MSGATTGKTAYLKEAPLAYINQRVGIVRGCSKYCYYCFQVDGFFQYISLLSAGSAQPNISMGQIQGFKIPFISDKEQQKIADYLDKRCEKIDTAIDNQKQIIEKLKEYKQSLITETVTKGLTPNAKMKDSGIEWIGSIPEHWNIRKAKHFLRQKGIKNKPNEEVLSLYRDLGVVIKSSREDNFNVTSENTENYKFVEENDVVINKMKTWQGSIAVSNYQGIVSPAYYVCEFTIKVFSRYIHYLLRNKAYIPEYRRLSEGIRIGQWDLGYDDFKNIPYIFPPLSEQKEIAEYLDKKCNQIDEAIKQKEETISKLEEYKKSLIFEYVTGKKEVA